MSTWRPMTRERVEKRCKRLVIEEQSAAVYSAVGIPSTAGNRQFLITLHAAGVIVLDWAYRRARRVRALGGFVAGISRHFE